IGRYAQWIAERDCAAVLMGAGPTQMAYHGARVASMATSPIAIAVPGGNGPIALDMASSTISNGKILQARATGGAVPAGPLLPGERGNRTETVRRKSGIPIPAKLREELIAVAKESGVRMPAYA